MSTLEIHIRAIWRGRYTAETVVPDELLDLVSDIEGNAAILGANDVSSRQIAALVVAFYERFAD